jgi:hypothetical protein
MRSPANPGTPQQRRDARAVSHEQMSEHEMEMTVSRGEFEQLQRQVAEMQKKLDDSAAISKSTNDMVRAIRESLMEPQPGHKESLLDRMAAATVLLESGGAMAGLVVRVAGLIVAIGIIYATFRFGQSVEGLRGE